MKRTYAVVTGLLLALATTAHAQGKGGSASIKAGLSYGNVSNTGVLPGTIQGRTGFAAGIAIGSPNQLLGFGAEALYAQRGVESTSVGGNRKLDYIDVPLFLRVSVPGPLSPFGYAGPQVSFELSCRTETSVCPATNRPSRIYSGVAGGGVRLGVGTAVSLEGRYIYGLTDLRLSTVTSPQTYKTRSFLILVGVGI